MSGTRLHSETCRLSQAGRQKQCLLVWTEATPSVKRHTRHVWRSKCLRATVHNYIVGEHVKLGNTGIETFDHRWRSIKLVVTSPIWQLLSIVSGELTSSTPFRSPPGGRSSEVRSGQPSWRYRKQRGLVRYRGSYSTRGLPITMVVIESNRQDAVAFSEIKLKASGISYVCKITHVVESGEAHAFPSGS